MEKVTGNRPGTLPLEDGLGFGANTPDVFVGANPASIWRYYNEEDHRKGLTELKKLGINCIRTPLNYDIYQRDPSSYLTNVKSFLKVCDEYKIRVQFILWDAEQSLEALISDVAYSLLSQNLPEPTAYHSTGSNEFALSVDHPRNPYLSIAASAGFFTDFAGDYLDALASSVSGYQSMWCFDLCSKPTSEFFNLAVSSQSRLNQNLSATNIKYTFSPKDGLNIFNDTSYLDNGKGTGPSGAFGIEDIKNFSSIIDFVSVPFIANNDYAFNRYLNGSISGATAQGISKPFMVYAAYDPELGQNLNSTLGALGASSVGYFSDLGLVDNVFRFGKGKSENIYSDGQYKDFDNASALLTGASSINWYNRRDLTKVLRLKQKEDGSDGFLSGVPSTLTSLDRDVSPSAVEHWSYLKDYYVNTPFSLETVLSRVSGASTTFKPRFDSKYIESLEHNVLASSFYSNSLEENLDILYNFDTHFPSLATYAFSTGGDDWQVINKQMIIRNGFLQSLAKFVVDYDSSTVPYAELRNTSYDTNPIPDYERGVLTELIEFMTDSYVAKHIGQPDIWSPNPTTSRLEDLSSTFTYKHANAFYGVSDSGSDFSIYYDDYYQKLVDQLKKCLMWLYWKGSTDSNFKIVSDSFLDKISFTPSSLSSIETYSSEVTANGDYVPGNLSSVTSPLYITKILNPDTKTWASSLVMVASGQAREITQYQVDGIFSTYGLGPIGSHAPVSFTNFGTSGMARVRVERADQTSINSFEIYPKRTSKYRPGTIRIITDGGETYKVLEFTTYIGDKLLIELDGNTSAPLCVYSDPFKPAIPSGLNTYSGTNRSAYSRNEPSLNLTSSTDSWLTVDWETGPDKFSSYPGDLYFPPGVHNVSAGLPLSAATTVYIDANAYIKGGFDVLSGFNCKFMGRGVISAEMYPRDPFIYSVKALYSDGGAGFYMPIGASTSAMDTTFAYGKTWPGSIVEGLTLINQAFYGTARKVCLRHDNCKQIAPWTYNADGLKCAPNVRMARKGITNSMMMCGDDTMTPFTALNTGPAYFRNNFVIPYRSSVVATYYGGGVNHRLVVKDIDVLSYSFSGTQPAISPGVGNALINIYANTADGQTFETGIGNVLLENWDIHGGDGSAIHLPMYHISNSIYIYDNETAGRVGLGVLSGIEITNMSITPSAVNPPVVSACSSTIYGVSAGQTPAQAAVGSLQLANRPMNITFTNFKIAPNEFLTDANVDDFTMWYNPLSATISVTDPDSVSGADSNIVFKTT